MGDDNRIRETSWLAKLTILSNCGFDWETTPKNKVEEQLRMMPYINFGSHTHTPHVHAYEMQKGED